jgi:amino acid transporter
MWIGIFAALLLCLATAVSYAEISKLYPGTGSSYYYAEQSMLSKTRPIKYARIAKFIVGWGSHLYYWVYPGVMVATTGVFVGYVVGFLYPTVMSGGTPDRSSWLWWRCLHLLRRVDRATGRQRIDGRQSAINIIQISALVGVQHSWPSAIASTIRKAPGAEVRFTPSLATYDL